MEINFTKMQALGNDFVVIDAVTQDIKLTIDQIKFIADRHYGIGCDQILLLSPPKQEDVQFFYRIFNADGSEVGQCGNGARCIARFAVDRGLVSKPFFKVSTIKTTLELLVHDNGEVTVNMGVPSLMPDKIPTILTPKNHYYELMTGKQTLQFQAVNIGNPHVIIWAFASNLRDRNSIISKLRNTPGLPSEININFAEMIDPYHVNLHVYEYGVGWTEACGSGACATVAAGIAGGQLARKVVVQQPGGKLTIEWPHDEQALYMTGPAQYVFEGKITL